MTRALVWLSLLLAGCGNDFDPLSFVDGLRVLAVQAEPPEVARGERTRVTALAWDTRGETITYEWATCQLAPTPIARATVNRECLDDPPQLMRLDGGVTTTVTMPELDPFTLGIPDATLGLYLPVRLTVRAPGSDPVVSFYQLRFAQGIAPNHNPTLQGIFVVPAGDGGAPAPLDEQTPLPLAAQGSITLRAPFTDDSAEPELVLDPAHLGQPMVQPEQLRVSWYATAGSFSQQATGESQPDTVFRLDKHVPAAGAIIDLWAVGIDERGGTDSVHRQLQVQ